MTVPVTLNTVAVVGNGLVGHGMAQIFAATGHRVVMIGRREESLAAAMDLKLRQLMPPLFVAIAGRPNALPLFDSMAWLGRDLTRDRLRSAIEALGGVSRKEGRRLERAYRQLW